jgi:iron complex outermembrane recepter protein
MRKGMTCRKFSTDIPRLAMVGVAAAAVCGAARAQQVGAASVSAPEQLEEVVVTARLREERLQDVPASISVLSGTQLENANANNLIDVATLLPNFRFTQGYRPGVLQIAMRGIGTVQGGESPVAVIVDGVQVPAMDFINQELLDVQSIEVLRGPQGALYGRGALVGALSINTKQPSATPSGEFRVTYGSADTRQLFADISGPVAGNGLLGTLAITHSSDNGFTPDAITGRLLDSSWLNAARGELVMKPADGTQITLGGAASIRREGADPLDRISVSQIDNFSIHPAQNLATNDYSNLRNAFLKVEQATPLGNFNSISQYAWSSDRLDGEGDFTAAPIAAQIDFITVEAVNEDLRLTSPEDQRFRWLVGTFFQDRLGWTYGNIYGDPSGAHPYAPLGLVDDRNRSTAAAAYTRLDLDATDKLNLSAALRYDRDRRQDRDPTVAASAAEHTFTQTEPQVTASYHNTARFLSYVTVGKGFLSGGFNSYSSSQQLNLPRLYPAESLWNYEAGIKSEWLDHRLTLNADVFYMNIDNAQLFIQHQLPSYQFITYVDKSDVKGGELEATFRSFGGLSLDASVGINDSKIKDFNGTALYVGDKLPNAYNPTVNVGAQYEWRLVRDLKGLARVDYQHLGEVYYNQTTIYRFGPTNYYNARLAIEETHWNVALWGKNLGDQRAPRNFSPQSCGVDCSGRMDNIPRTYGVEAEYTF